MDQEIKRQGIHFLMGNFGILFFLAAGKIFTVAVGLLLLLFGYAVALSLQKGKKVPFADEILKHVERNHEQHLPGKAALLFLAGYILTIAIFTNPWATLAGIIVLTYGDSVATLVGKYFGSFKLITNRTLEGTLAGIVFSMGMLSLFPAIYPFAIAFAIATVGMLAEYLPLDDNLGIPIIAGLVASVLL
ncbi:MAG: diacylglycerol/polyprenol kinase family protein [Candidatus Micrarchaeota archaeon]